MTRAGAASPAGRSVARIAVCIADFPNLGDHLVQLPLYLGLRERFPGAHLLLASRYPQARIAVEHGFADELVLYRRADLELWRRVRAYRPDVSVCLRASSKRAALCFGRPSGARVTVGLGGTTPSLFYSRRAPLHERVYRPYRYLAALAPLDASASLRASIERLAAGSAWLPAAAEYGVLAPNGMLEEKQWGAARYARLAARLARERPGMAWYAVLGARELEAGYAAAMQAGFPALRLLAELALPDLARVMLGARLVLANDCGPGNLAQMAGAPIALAFGNWDDDVELRSDWWFDRRPGAICVTTRARATAAGVPDEALEAAASALLADPCAGPRLVWA